MSWSQAVQVREKQGTTASIACWGSQQREVINKTEHYSLQKQAVARIVLQIKYPLVEQEAESGKQRAEKPITS